MGIIVILCVIYSYIFRGEEDLEGKYIIEKEDLIKYLNLEINHKELLKATLTLKHFINNLTDILF